MPKACVLGHRSQEILVSIMIHWSYKFEKHSSYSCYILHSPQSKRSGKCCTGGESQHTTAHNSRNKYKRKTHQMDSAMRGSQREDHFKWMLWQESLATNKNNCPQPKSGGGGPVYYLLSLHARAVLM